MHTRPIRTLGVLFALSLVLTACDPQDVLQLFDGHAVKQAAPADADTRDADTETEERSDAGRRKAHGDRTEAAHEHDGEKRDTARAERRDRRRGDRAEAAHEHDGEKRDTARAERRDRRRTHHGSDKPTTDSDKDHAGGRHNDASRNGGAGTARDAKPDANSGGGSGSLSDVEKAIFDRLNSTRRSAGLRALTQSAAISKGARSWSCQMAQTGNFDHSDLRSAGVSGENIAWGQSGADAVHDSWMQSSGHRANRMNSSWDEYGIGVCKDGNGRPYYTERFR